MIYRAILPKWAKKEYLHNPPVVEGEFTQEHIDSLMGSFYNIYFLPNYPSEYTGKTVTGGMIDTFNFVFVDMDLKDGKYASKEAFISKVREFNDIKPSYIVDSGNGIHVYWQVVDLDAMSYLRLQRRLMRFFDTDPAVGQIFQLMRVPGTVNTKSKDNFILCEYVDETSLVYTCEQLDKALPPITQEDEDYCQHHLDKTYNRNQDNLKVDDKIPLKFANLLKSNREVKEIWSGNVDDRSKADFRLGHIMFGNSFTKEEAMSVLVNSAKAYARAPQHRVSYAENIVEKIWTYEVDKSSGLSLSQNVLQILSKNNAEQLKGTRFPCWQWLDATEHGFRLGQVIGLVAGTGVGKTAMALNMFEGFVQNNPDYDHFFVPLEQPATEIAHRWKTMCGDKTNLYEKVHVLSNYNDDGSYRHLSLTEIKDYLLKFQSQTKRKIGCVVIDHIGALKKEGRTGENQDLMDICHEMKAFAIQTNTLLIMQSQSSREKAGIGDLELNKDAAYGTIYFESYCDYLMAIWQPLKRCYDNDACPTITSFKFCKIRHKRKGLDLICEDVCYNLYFDSETEHLRELTQDEETSFKYWNTQATNKRKRDRKTDLVTYKSIRWTKDGTNVKDSQDSTTATRA